MSRDQSDTVVAYDRRAVYAMLRDWTPEQLREELAAGRFGAALTPAEDADLDDLLTAWLQRALGAQTLRDALLIDRQRGQRVFDLICVALTHARAVVPAELSPMLPAAPATIETLPLARGDELGPVSRLAATKGLALAVLSPTGSYPFPDDLATLVPPPPTPIRRPGPIFEQPTGWRRRSAILLATAGVSLLALPLLLGHIPEHPAGPPLALLTLALLVGIRAGPAGFAGSLCIWLVANLPGFRYGSSLLSILWPALPLMLAGVGLLCLDRRVRALWLWLRRQIGAE